MSRKEAIAEIERYKSLCLRAYVALDRVLEMNDEILLSVAQSPLSLIEMYVKGVPIGRAIKRIREEQGCSLDDLEKRTGIKKKILSDYETEHTHYIPYDDLEQIRRALHCSREYMGEMFNKKEG